MGVGTTAINAFAAYQKNEISKREYEQAVAAANELERKLKTLRPDETWQNIDPQLLQASAKYSPEISAFVQENAPDLVTEPQSQTEKRVQREALQKYAAMSETGRDVISEAQREQALFEADARAKERQQRLMEGLRRQGQLGSGAALAAQLQVEQGENVAARQEALQGAMQAEARRREALGQAASLAGQIRSQNVSVESANVGTMNAFNQRLANAKNMYNQYTANTRNQAEMLNQQREMQREQYNLGLQNQYALMNRQQQLAARERARQYDVDVAKTLFGARTGAEASKFAADRQFLGDVGTAITSGIGTGMSTYGGLSSAAASGAKADYFKALGQGAVQGAGQAAAGQALTRVAEPSQTDFEMRVIPKQSLSSSLQLEDQQLYPSSESFVGPQQVRSGPVTQESVIPFSTQKGLSGYTDYESPEEKRQRQLMEAAAIRSQYGRS
jgi:hypothetical protein